MEKYSRRNVKIDPSTHPTYGTIVGATVEVIETETQRLVKTFQADDRDGKEAVKKASTEAMHWIHEHERLEAQLALLDKQATHAVTAVGAVQMKDRELARKMLDDCTREIREQKDRIKAHLESTA